jgi:hypothetical protein
MFDDVSSGHLTFGHVASGSHATSGHVQLYILDYRACAEHTSGKGCFRRFRSRMHNDPIPPDDPPAI